MKFGDPSGDSASPYKRIDLSRKKEAPAAALSVYEEAEQKRLHEIKLHEAQRIWSHLVDVCRGN